MQTAMRRGCLLMIVFASACSGGGASEVASTAAEARDGGAAADIGGARERPFKGWCDTRFEIVGMTFDGPRPTAMDIEISGTCQLAHLGQTSLTALQHVVIPASGPQVISNAGTLEAANGDKVRSAFAGLGLPVFLDPQNPATSPVIGFTFEGTDTYSGGDGRFTSTSGSAELVGSAFFDPPEGSTPPMTGSGYYEVTGTITY